MRCERNTAETHTVLYHTGKTYASSTAVSSHATKPNITYLFVEFVFLQKCTFGITVNSTHKPRWNFSYSCTCHTCYV